MEITTEMFEMMWSGAYIAIKALMAHCFIKMTSKMSVLRSALNRPYQCDDPVKSCGKLFSENELGFRFPDR